MLSEIKKAFSILQLSITDDTGEIERATRKLAFKYHPDKWINASVAEQTNAGDLFKEIQNAKSFLLDPTTNLSMYIPILRQEYESLNIHSQYVMTKEDKDAVSEMADLVMSQYNQTFFRPTNISEKRIKLPIAIAVIPRLLAPIDAKNMYGYSASYGTYGYHLTHFHSRYEHYGWKNYGFYRCTGRLVGDGTSGAIDYIDKHYHKTDSSDNYSSMYETDCQIDLQQARIRFDYKYKENNNYTYFNSQYDSYILIFGDNHEQINQLIHKIKVLDKGSKLYLLSYEGVKPIFWSFSEEELKKRVASSQVPTALEQHKDQINRNLLIEIGALLRQFSINIGEEIEIHESSKCVSSACTIS